MKKHIHIMLVATVALASCGKKSDNKEVNDADTTKTEQSSVVESQPACFAYEAKGDSAFLKINIADSLVTGDLTYALAEKDKNIGKIDGRIVGDTLLVDYTFMSEGVESTRQAAFLRKGNDWVEGFGPVADKKGTMSFTDRAKLNFENGLLFKAVDCN
ncbi:hypothetical protein [Dyadobacter sp. CY326]|uniref:hypothetical protein n=1 Tax=Dyadobacter sp. CY326 TaxID=2907300 RepID=UPI001F18F881|nr:hypothetical protein [Dyadobacter sp. CY326]MCE7065690.1 hypothetical protein [Dyadobacter sp. CY326]